MNIAVKNNDGKVLEKKSPNQLAYNIGVYYYDGFVPYGGSVARHMTCI